MRAYRLSERGGEAGLWYVTAVICMVYYNCNPKRYVLVCVDMFWCVLELISTCVNMFWYIMIKVHLLSSHRIIVSHHRIGWFGVYSSFFLRNGLDSVCLSSVTFCWEDFLRPVRPKGGAGKIVSSNYPMIDSSHRTGWASTCFFHGTVPNTSVWA